MLKSMLRAQRFVISYSQRKMFYIISGSKVIVILNIFQWQRFSNLSLELKNRHDIMQLFSFFFFSFFFFINEQANINEANQS